MPQPRCPSPDDHPAHEDFWDHHYCIPKAGLPPSFKRGQRLPRPKSDRGAKPAWHCCPPYSRLITRRDTTPDQTDDN